MASTSHGIQVVERERVAIPTPTPGSTGADSSAAERPSMEGDGRSVPVAGLGVLGALTLLVGAWGGIVPFIGPLIHNNADGSMSWYWSLPHALLWVAPGAAACLAGAVMLGALPRAMSGFGRLGAFGAGALAALSGAWFVVGPLAWPVLQRSAGVFVPAGPLTMLTHEIGYSFGPGLLLVLLGAMAMAMGMAGRTVHRPAPERRTSAAAVKTPAVKGTARNGPAVSGAH